MVKNHHCQGSQNEMIFHHHDWRSGCSVLVFAFAPNKQGVSHEHGHKDTDTDTHTHTLPDKLIKLLLFRIVFNEGKSFLDHFVIILTSVLMSLAATVASMSINWIRFHQQSQRNKADGGETLRHEEKCSHTAEGKWQDSS